LRCVGVWQHRLEVWAEGEEGPQMHFFGGEQAMDDFLLASKLPQASASRTSLIRYRLFPRGLLGCLRKL
jgi:hypothetical protein